jgi:hypothetical protein
MTSTAGVRPALSNFTEKSDAKIFVRLYRVTH